MGGWNKGINGVTFPSVCRDCKPPRRRVNCHAGCRDYLDAKAAYDKLAEAERAARRAQHEAERAAFLMKKG